MQTIDMAILEWIQANVVCGWLTPFFKVCTYFAELGIGWIALAVVLLLFKRTRRMGLIMGIALLLGVLLGEYGIKLLFQRPRPFVTAPEVALLISPPHGFSFPSGHTTASFAAACSMLFIDKKWGLLALVLAVLIGFSRMYFFVHYLTDVLAGVVLGILCALAAHWIMKMIEKRWHIQWNTD